MDKREEEEGAQRDRPPVEQHSPEFYFYFRVLAQTRTSTPGKLESRSRDVLEKNLRGMNAA